MSKKISELSVWWNPHSCWYFKDCDESFEPLPFNLEDVYDWHVRWNLLHVQHTPDSKWVEYEPHVCASQDIDSYKEPHRVWLDGKRAEEYEGW